MTAKALKNALLQEAVQGKLVPQIASEGNARDLLEEIRNEKLSHGLDFANAKSGKRKSKKETALAGSNPCDITEEEIPFDIPESWCWCRLGELGYTTTGSTPSKSNQNYFGDFIDFLSPGDIQNSIITYGKQGLSRSGYEVSRPTPKGTILQVCIGGSIGKCAITDREVTFNQQINGLTPIFSLSEYLFAVFSSDYFYKKITGNSTGTATPIINKSAWELLPIPLPPLSEQKRIVAAIEKFMPLIEEYGKKETELKAINEKIGTLTKKAILQEAVQGKLVPQITSEGNAKDLLEEIRKERLSHGLDFANAKSGKRKSKKETALAGSNPCDITEEEIPFDIPESWCWCRLGEIGDWKAGSTPSRSNPELYNGNIPWLKTGDLTDGDINEIPECISEKALESCSMRLNPIGSVLIAMYGATIGKLGILKIEATTNQACCACVPYNGIYNKYLFYYLMSQKKDFTEKAEGGAQPNISREKLVVHLLPLPPLSEQKRIVAAIEKILPLCEKLGE